MKCLIAPCLVCSISSLAMYGQASNVSPTTPKATGDHHETFTGVIEKVFKVDDDGFISMYYLVQWKGKSVIVDDPIHSTDLNVGDEVKVLAIWQDMSDKDGSKKLLHFLVL